MADALGSSASNEWRRVALPIISKEMQLLAAGEWQASTEVVRASRTPTACATVSLSMREKLKTSTSSSSINVMEIF